MPKHKIVACTFAALFAAGCHDLAAPAARSLARPTGVSITEFGPPDVTYTVNTAPLSSQALYNFAHDTWVVTTAAGTESFTARSPVQGASPYYVYPGRSVDATGVIDQRSGYGCALHLMFFNGSGTINGSFGLCGATARVDTSKMQGAVTLKRGPIPYNNPYDCDIWGVATCHTVSGGNETVRQTPVLVTINKPTTSRAVLDTISNPNLNFRASYTPDSLTVGGVRRAHPFYITQWQWQGADYTRNPLTGCVASNLLCVYSPREAGRMVVKMFVGGWEQVSTVTVQCLTHLDPALDDSLNDFRVRQDLLEVLVTSNADSTPGAGWTGSDWDRTKSRHESGGVIWLLPDGRYFFVPYEDPTSTAVHYYLPDDQRDAAHAPVPGAVVYATVHDHPTKFGQGAYGFDGTDILASGERGPCAKYPGDTWPSGILAPACQKAAEGANWTGDGGDSAHVTHTGKPDFEVNNNGTVWRLDYPKTTTPFVYSGGAHPRCSWVKKYKA